MRTGPRRARGAGAAQTAARGAGHKPGTATPLEGRSFFCLADRHRDVALGFDDDNVAADVELYSSILNLFPGGWHRRLKSCKITTWRALCQGAFENFLRSFRHINHSKPLARGGGEG